MTKDKCLLLTAGIVLAMAFTVSCTSDIESAEEILARLSSSSEGNSQSYGYCLFSENEMCLEGPYTLDDCNSIGGRPSNSCPYSSVALPSSSGGEAPSSSSVETGDEPSSSSDAPSSPSVVPSSSGGEVPSSSSVEAGNEPSSPSVVPSSGSVVPSSSSALPSSSSVMPSSSSSVPSSSSAPPSSSSSSSPSSSSALPSSSSVSGAVYGTPVTYGGETYQTVVIGTQTWFARNLNYDPGTGSSACYDKQASNCATYGRLYDWATAKTVCPSGWHLPSNADWDKLFRYVDGTSGTGSPYESPTAGRYLKATSGWNNNGNGTDQYGFSALPGGDGFSDGSFYYVGYEGNWWSASEYNYSSHAYYRYMYYINEYAYWDIKDKSYLFSVRCLQD